MASESLRTSFLGALQASVAVLLTISYGVMAAQFNLIRGNSTKDISSVCVKMFLPVLLLTNVGDQLHVDTGVRYVPILVWSLTYILVSLGVAGLAVRVFKLPSWVTPAICFNNTTSLPLLLLQSLETTGILSRLVVDESDSAADAIKRAKSYFLVAAVVSNSLTFAVGPRLLKEEDGSESDDDDDDSGKDDGDDEHVVLQQDETTSLLPDGLYRREREAGRWVLKRWKAYGRRLSPRTRDTLGFFYAFVNAPVIGAVGGVIVGLSPPLHRAFFNDARHGGVFNAWLTSSLRNIGDLFVTLQVVVVGVKLSSSMRKSKRGEESGDMPWISALLVLLIRFAIWPVISIFTIKMLAVHTTLLTDDPMLWFVLMLIPTGPSAMNLTAMVEINRTAEMEKMAIAKFLTISYAVSPLICFAVVGSLKSCEAAIT